MGKRLCRASGISLSGEKGLEGMVMGEARVRGDGLCRRNGMVVRGERGFSEAEIALAMTAESSLGIVLTPNILVVQCSTSLNSQV